MTLYTATYNSPLGPIVIESDGEALTGLRFGDSGIGKALHLMPTHATSSLSIFDEAIRWLDDYFDRRKEPFWSFFWRCIRLPLVLCIIILFLLLEPSHIVLSWVFACDIQNKNSCSLNGHLFVICLQIYHYKFLPSTLF